MAAFPRASIRLRSSQALRLKEELMAGSVDAILTTDPYDIGTGECLHSAPVRWFMAKGSTVYEQRPLPIAYERKCIFLPLVVRRWMMPASPEECPISRMTGAT